MNYRQLEQGCLGHTQSVGVDEFIGEELGKELGDTGCAFSLRTWVVLTYRVTLVVVDLGWVDFGLHAPPSCLAALSDLLRTPNCKSTQPKSATT